MTAPDDTSVVILFEGSLGDHVLALQLCQMFQDYYPRLSLSFFGSHPVIRLFTGSAAVQHADLLDADALRFLHGEPATFPPWLYEPLCGAHLVVVALASPGDRVLYDLRQSARTEVIHLHPWPINDPAWLAQPLALHWRHRLASAGLTLPVPRPPLLSPPRPTPHHLPANLDLGRPLFVLTPGASTRRKRWPFDSFLALAAGLSLAQVCWVIGPVELHQSLHEQSCLMTRCQTAGDWLIAAEPLETFAQIVALADWYIGNDTGTTHLAAALGVPTVAIFGPTNVDVWSPQNPQVRVLDANDYGGPLDTVEPRHVLGIVDAESPIDRTP